LMRRTKSRETQMQEIIEGIKSLRS
jgi:hypothetical protein